MKFAESSYQYIIRLDPGEDILASLQHWCRQQGIVNAEVTGIGSIADPTLAHYRRDTKKFSEKTFKGIYEITALVGNVGLVDGHQPLVHLHITIAGEAMNVHGGHLVSGVCSATAELMVKPLPTRFHKRYDAEIGLKIWDFSD